MGITRSVVLAALLVAVPLRAHAGDKAAWTAAKANLSKDTTVLVGLDLTQLTLTGFYEVRTSEAVGDLNVYDTGSIGFTQTNGTPIAMVNSFSNITPTTVWTAINYTFPQTMSGQTIRLRMQSSNDIINPTSFYFDSFALNATHCP